MPNAYPFETQPLGSTSTQTSPLGQSTYVASPMTSQMAPEYPVSQTNSVPNFQSQLNSVIQPANFFSEKRNLIALVVVAFVVLGGWLFMQNMAKPSQITVVGEGKVSVPPAKVSMIVARVNSSNDPMNAISDGETGMMTLIDSAKAIGGSGTEIQSSFYTVTPSLNASGKVFQVANAFKVTISDPSKVGELIRTFYKEGASSVTNISFSPADQEKVSQEARLSGVKKAKEEAQMMAKAAGKRLGKLITIADDMTEAVSVVSTEVGSQETTSGIPATIDITKKVSATYEIW